MKTLLVVGGDKIGRSLLGRLPPGVEVEIVIDRSSSWRRVASVLLKRAISPVALWLMWRAESRRTDTRVGAYSSIRSNDELLEVVRRMHPRRIILFRAGLILNRALLDAGAEVLNLHCARLPDFAGLGAIHRALRRGDLQQCATLHRVTERIDAGKVVATLPYALDPARSYFDNEQMAYETGIALLLDQLKPGEGFSLG